MEQRMKKRKIEIFPTSRSFNTSKKRCTWMKFTTQNRNKYTVLKVSCPVRLPYAIINTQSMIWFHICHVGAEGIKNYAMNILEIF